MDHVSDIPLPGEDLNHKNEFSHIQQEGNISDYNKPVDNLNYDQNTTYEYDQTTIMINQELQSQTVQNQSGILESMSFDNKEQVSPLGGAVHMLHDSIMETDQSLANDEKNVQQQPMENVIQVQYIENISLQQNANQEQHFADSIVHEQFVESEQPVVSQADSVSQERINEAVENLQKFVEQTTQEAMAAAAAKSTASMQGNEELNDSTTSKDEMILSSTDVSSNAIETEIVDFQEEPNSDHYLNISNSHLSDHQKEIIVDSSEAFTQKNKTESNQQPEKTATTESVQETSKSQEVMSDKPSKSKNRRNSTVEAIKDDWSESESYIIEEIKSDIELNSSQGENEARIEPVITEPAEEPAKQDDDLTETQVIVLENVNEGVQLNLNQNIHIEYIDEIDHVNDKQQNKKAESSSKNVSKLPQKTSTRVRGKPPRLNSDVPIPCHLLGRSVDNPTEDLISNGRTPPKPRLGVKVPYRFLTSQIVSKEDITKEILELQAKRLPEADPPVGGDIFFAKKLTQRLADKICDKKKETRSEPTTSGVSTTAASISTNNISDNSDLLAILEGNVDVDLTKEIKNTKRSHLKSSDGTDNDSILTADKVLSNEIVKEKLKLRNANKSETVLTPEKEREMALKQLQNMPRENKRQPMTLGRKPRSYYYYKSEKVEQSTAEPKKNVEDVKTKKVGPPSKSSKTIVESTTSESIKKTAENILTKLKEKKLLKEKTPEKDISDDLLETALTPKKVAKTYSRKEAVINVPVPADLEAIVNETDQSALEMLEESLESPTKETTELNESTESSSSGKKFKRPLFDKNNPEITLTSKRARVIKRKVIWDPAESDKPKSSNKKGAIVKEIKRGRSRKSIEGADSEETEQDTSISDKLTESRGRGRPKKVVAVAETEEKVEVAEKTSENRTRGRPRKSVSTEDSGVENVSEISDKSTPLEDKKNADKKSETSKDLKENTEEIESLQESTPKLRGRPRKSLQKSEEIDDKSEDETVEEDASTSQQQKSLKASQIIPRSTIARVQKAKNLMKRGKVRSLTGKVIRSTSKDLKSSIALTKKKKQLVAEIARKVSSANKDKPKRTELDRLLMDEGAVNMLYSVRQDRTGKTAKRLIPSKDLLNRTKALREVITQTSTQEDSPKLRKKEISAVPSLQMPVNLPRKKSRDSIRSSLQSPPPSPGGYIHPNRAEASRIIRRHSSSFSSECSSPRRLSIDNQAGQDKNFFALENISKQEEIKKEDEKQEDATSSRTLRRKGIPIFERKIDEKTYKGKKKLLPDSSNKDDTKKPETESTERLAAVDKTEKLFKTEKEKLTASDKRKLNTEMMKNFSIKSPQIKKRTRSSKTEDEIVDVSVENPEKEMTTKKLKVNKNEKEESKTQRTRHISVTTDYKEISIRKIDNLVQIILTPTCSKIKNSINLPMLQELTDLLTNLSVDDTCRVVLLTSTDSSFCHGLDFAALVHSNVETRNSFAKEMADVLKKFLKTLAHFPKPLIAGVQGPAVGLGVTILPLFDLVFASDKATFSTPYGRLGQVPEGVAFLTLPNLLGSTLTSELMFANRKLTAAEALNHGLVTRTLWPDKFHEELVSNAVTIATQSAQSMMATKKLLRQSLLSNLDEALDTENELLVQHWTSAECQQNFKNLLQEDEWW